MVGSAAVASNDLTARFQTVFVLAQGTSRSKRIFARYIRRLSSMVSGSALETISAEPFRRVEPA